MILPTSNVVIFGNNLVNFNRKTKYNTNKSLNNGSTRFTHFPGATSKELLNYIDTTLQDNLFEVAVIYVGINGIVNNKNSLNTDHMLGNIKDIAWKCKRYGIQKILILGLLTTNVVDKLEVKNMCNIEGIAM